MTPRVDSFTLPDDLTKRGTDPALLGPSAIAGSVYGETHRIVNFLGISTGAFHARISQSEPLYRAVHRASLCSDDEGDVSCAAFLKSSQGIAIVWTNRRHRGHASSHAGRYRQRRSAAMPVPQRARRHRGIANASSSSMATPASDESTNCSARK